MGCRLVRRRLLPALAGAKSSGARWPTRTEERGASPDRHRPGSGYDEGRAQRALPQLLDSLARGQPGRRPARRWGHRQGIPLRHGSRFAASHRRDAGGRPNGRAPESDRCGDRAGVRAPERHRRGRARIRARLQCTRRGHVRSPEGTSHARRSSRPPVRHGEDPVPAAPGRAAGAAGAPIHAQLDAGIRGPGQPALPADGLARRSPAASSPMGLLD